MIFATDQIGAPSEVEETCSPGNQPPLFPASTSAQREAWIRGEAAQLDARVAVCVADGRMTPQKAAEVLGKCRLVVAMREPMIACTLQFPKTRAACEALATVKGAA